MKHTENAKMHGSNKLSEMYIREGVFDVAKMGVKALAGGARDLGVNVAASTVSNGILNAVKGMFSRGQSANSSDIDREVQRKIASLPREHQAVARRHLQEIRRMVIEELKSRGVRIKESLGAMYRESGSKEVTAKHFEDFFLGNPVPDYVKKAINSNESGIQDKYYSWTAKNFARLEKIKEEAEAHKYAATKKPETKPSKQDSAKKSAPPKSSSPKKPEATKPAKPTKPAKTTPTAPDPAPAPAPKAPVSPEPAKPSNVTPLRPVTSFPKDAGKRNEVKDALKVITGGKEAEKKLVAEIAAEATKVEAKAAAMKSIKGAKLVKPASVAAPFLPGHQSLGKMYKSVLNPKQILSNLKKSAEKSIAKSPMKSVTIAAGVAAGVGIAIGYVGGKLAEMNNKKPMSDADLRAEIDRNLEKHLSQYPGSASIIQKSKLDPGFRRHLVNEIFETARAKMPKGQSKGVVEGLVDHGKDLAQTALSMAQSTSKAAVQTGVHGAVIYGLGKAAEKVAAKMGKELDSRTAMAAMGGLDVLNAINSAKRMATQQDQPQQGINPFPFSEQALTQQLMHKKNLTTQANLRKQIIRANKAGEKAGFERARQTLGEMVHGIAKEALPDKPSDSFQASVVNNYVLKHYAPSLSAVERNAYMAKYNNNVNFHKAEQKHHWQKIKSQHGAQLMQGIDPFK